MTNSVFNLYLNNFDHVCVIHKKYLGVTHKYKNQKKSEISDFSGPPPRGVYFGSGPPPGGGGPKTAEKWGFGGQSNSTGPKNFFFNQIKRF